MYVRYHGNYWSSRTNQPYGIFVVIYHLHRDGKLLEHESEVYLNAKEWFEENLPNPPYYDENNNSIGAVTWFKESEKSIQMVQKLKAFLDIAAKYNVEIIKSTSVEVPGELVYEDDYQIGVVMKN